MNTHNEQQWRRWAQDRDERMNEMRRKDDEIARLREHSSAASFWAFVACAFSFAAAAIGLLAYISS